MMSIFEFTDIEESRLRSLEKVVQRGTGVWIPLSPGEQLHADIKNDYRGLVQGTASAQVTARQRRINKFSKGVISVRCKTCAWCKSPDKPAHSKA